MTLSLTHTFQSAKADDGDTSLVRPSNWNAEHTITAAANKILGTTTAGAVGELDCTAAGRALLDDADAAAQRTTLGLGNVDNTADMSKPVSTATAAAIALTADYFKYVGANTHAIAIGPGSYDGATYDATGGVVSGLTGLLTGVDSISVGRDCMTAASNVSTLCIGIGPRAFETGATNYACIGVGYRTLRELAGGAYVTAIGIDCFPVATSGSNATAVGAHAGTYKSGEFTASVAIGTGAAYCGGGVSNSILIGPNCADGGATSDVYNAADLVAIGVYAARKVTGQYNVFLGNSAASFTTVTGALNLGIGRSSAPALTSGSGNTMVGDSAGTGISTTSYSTAIGFQAGGGYTESIAIGYNAAPTAARQCRIGDANLSEIVSAAALIPAADNAVTVGKSGTRYSAIWAANGTIQTSDEREKVKLRNITPSEARTFVKMVDPFFFRWKDGGNTVEGVPVVRTRKALDANGNEIEENYTATESRITRRDGVRVHASVGAQTVKSAMDAIGQDFGAWCLDDAKDPESRQSIRADQLQWMLWTVVQDLMRENASMSHRIAQLEAA